MSKSRFIAEACGTPHEHARRLGPHDDPPKRSPALDLSDRRSGATHSWFFVTRHALGTFEFRNRLLWLDLESASGFCSQRNTTIIASTTESINSGRFISTKPDCVILKTYTQLALPYFGVKSSNLPEDNQIILKLIIVSSYQLRNVAYINSPGLKGFMEWLTIKPNKLSVA